MMNALRKANRPETNTAVKSKKQKSSGKKAAVIMAVVIVIVGILSGCFFYVQSYEKADSRAKAALVDNEDVVVTEFDGYYLFERRELASDTVLNYSEKQIFDKNKTEKPVDEEKLDGPAIIFYPGGKVEENAYAPLAQELVEIGYSVFLVKMPFRLAVLDMDAADQVIDGHPEVTSWTMMGHSLGGAMAASYTAKHANTIENLVLLGAYSTADLTGTDVKVLLIYGSEDGVLNRDNYESNLQNLPEDYSEHEIEGGNHAYYGNYGEQNGDGQASITQKEQQQEVIDWMLKVYGKQGDRK